MSNIKFELNLNGLREILKSSEMHAIANAAAAQIAAAANSSCKGYEVEQAHNLSFDTIAAVSAKDYLSRKDNATNNTLKKAAGGVKI